MTYVLCFQFFLSTQIVQGQKVIMKTKACPYTKI